MSRFIALMMKSSHIHFLKIRYCSSSLNTLGPVLGLACGCSFLRAFQPVRAGARPSPCCDAALDSSQREMQRGLARHGGGYGWLAQDNLDVDGSRHSDRARAGERC